MAKDSGAPALYEAFSLPQFSVSLSPELWVETKLCLDTGYSEAEDREYPLVPSFSTMHVTDLKLIKERQDSPNSAFCFWSTTHLSLPAIQVFWGGGYEFKDIPSLILLFPEEEKSPALRMRQFDTNNKIKWVFWKKKKKYHWKQNSLLVFQ